MNHSRSEVAVMAVASLLGETPADRGTPDEPAVRRCAQDKPFRRAGIAGQDIAARPEGMDDERTQPDQRPRGDASIGGDGGVVGQHLAPHFAQTL